MPTNYAGSTYIGTQPAVRKPRSFLDEEADPEFQAWAQEKGIAKPGGTTSGSVFMETVDKDGRPAYIARTLDQMDGWAPEKIAGGATLGRIRGTEDKDGRLVSFKVSKDEFGNDLITKGRDYGPQKLSNRQAEQYRERFNADLEAKKAEIERERRRSEAAIEAKRLSEQRIAEARAMGELGVELEGKKRALSSDPAKMTPREKADMAAAGLATAQIGQATKGIERNIARDQQLENEVNNIKAGYDAKGISSRGEGIIRAAAQSGASPEEAWAEGKRVTEEDIAKLRQLESSGDPDLIAQAAVMRKSDRDLAAQPDFTPPRSRASEDAFVSDKVRSFLDLLKTKADEENVSKRLSFGLDSGWDQYSDIDQDVQDELMANMDDAVMQIRRSNPRLETGRIKEIITSRMQARGFPPDYIAAVMAMVR